MQAEIRKIAGACRNRRSAVVHRTDSNPAMPAVSAPRRGNSEGVDRVYTDDELVRATGSENPMSLSKMTRAVSNCTRQSASEAAAFLQHPRSNIEVNLIGKSDLLCVNRMSSASAHLQPGW
jgi:hypothetical protein